MFNLKKGAVFGIDARIGLVLLSIASLAIAFNKQSLLESSKIQEISVRLLEVEDAIMEDYRKNYKSMNLITKGFDAMAEGEKLDMLQGKTSLLEDPWGNDWKIFTFISTDASMTAFGEKVEPVCIVLFSAGADGYHHMATEYNATNYAQCTSNVGLNYTATQTEESDDYFYKFTTIAYEVEINEDLETRLADIKQALYNYSEAKKSVRLQYCNDLTQTAANSDAKCDIDTNGTYEESELDNVNYMPKSSKDATAAVYESATVYDNATLAGLEAMLVEIGLPASHAKDLAGRQLDYHSNVNSSTSGSYVASFYYKVI